MEYVVGFAFSPTRSRVHLIRKDRPAWQRGLYNGVGGKIEEGETPHQAMIREFKEEAGLNVPNWEPVVRLAVVGNGAVIYFFRSVLLEGQKPFTQDETEPLSDILVSGVQFSKTIPNLKWLVPMALDDNVSGKDWVHITDVSGR